MNEYPMCAEKEPLTKPDLKEGLVNRKLRLESQLKEINEAIVILEENPEIARVLDLIGRAGRH